MLEPNPADDDDGPPEELSNYQAIAAQHEEDAKIAMSHPVNPNVCPNLNNRDNWTAADCEMYVDWFKYEKGYRWIKTYEKDIYIGCLSRIQPRGHRYL